MSQIKPVHGQHAAPLWPKAGWLRSLSSGGIYMYLCICELQNKPPGHQQTNKKTEPRAYARGPLAPAVMSWASSQMRGPQPDPSRALLL